MLLRLISAAPSGRTLTLVNGTVVTGYSLLAGADFGNAAWEHQFSGPRGTQGARPSSAAPQNRTVTLPIRIAGTSKDDLAAKKKSLEQLVDDLRRFGGQIVWQSNSASYRVWLDVKTATASTSDWGNRAEVINRAVVVIAANCAPYVEGDPMDLYDRFLTGSAITDYTFDAGAAGTAIDTTLNRMTFSTTGERRFYHSLSGYRPSDAEVAIGYVIGSTGGSPNIGVILRRQGPNDYLVAQIDGSGGTLRIKKVVAGVETSLANSAITALVAGNTYWLRFRAEGNNLYAEHWGSFANPYAGGATSAAATTVTYTLAAGAEQTQFGRGVKGQAGGRIAVAGTASATYLVGFRVEPYTYRGLKMPRELWLPQIDGDADATADFILNVRNASVTYAYGVVGWTRAPIEPWNMAWNGGAEAQTIYPWVTTAVTGVTAAALTVAQQAITVYAGNYSGRMTTNTSGQGVNHQVFRQFKKGVTYTFEVYLRSNTGATASVVVKLGVNGDLATSGAATLPLSGAMTRVTVTWTPTADRELAYAAIVANATAAYTIDFDAAQVYEGTTVPTASTHMWGRGGTLPFGAIYGGAREDVTTPGTFDLVADAQGFAGQTLQLTPGVSAAYSPTFKARVDPFLLWPDDYEKGTVDLEVWARIYFGADLIANGTARVQAQFGPYIETNVVNYSFLPIQPREPGCRPKIVPVGGGTAEWRWLRLGTFPVPAAAPGQTARMLYQLTVQVTGTAGAGADRLLKLDHVDIVPARSRFLGYYFGAWQLPIRVVKSDLSGYQGASQSVFAPFWDLTAVQGMGGAPLELPAANDLLLYVRPYAGSAPDTSGEGAADVNAFYTPVDVHLSVTPRWALLRDV